MRKRPILFSGPMVRALLEGRKTQTRRVVKPQFHEEGEPYFTETPQGVPAWCDGYGNFVWCPYGQPGDRLWVRETWREANAGWEPVGNGVRYRADERSKLDEGEGWPMRWRPSIHMPRWASRITLEITEVRVERLFDITAKQVLAEGVYLTMPNVSAEYGVDAEARACFGEVWDAIHGDGAWNKNPWVWALTFKRVTT